MKQQNNPSQEQHFKKIGDYVYSLDWKLGSGNFATVYRAVHSNTNQIYAIKVIKFSSLTTKLSMVLLQQQISILQMIDHPNIIKCHEVINSSNNCYIVMDFCKFGDLGTLLKIKKRFMEDEIANFVYELYQGLLYLAQNNIIHRDFKPMNIFMDAQRTCRIADFGFAIKTQERTFKDISLGSPFYMAPQIIYKKEYNQKTDVWAFGVTIYELVHGFPPLQGVRTPEELKLKVLEPVRYGKISARLQIFLQKCLTVDPSNRISFSEMKEQEYMKNILKEHTGSKNGSSQSSISQTQSCTKSSHHLLKQVLKNPISYDEAVSLLQYCRFLQNVCENINPKSQILQKWLLIMIKRLDYADLRQNQIGNYAQFKQIIRGYNQRYRKQFKFYQKQINSSHVLEECKKLIEIHKKQRSMIIMLGSQTQLLSTAFGHPLKLAFYAHESKITQYFSQLSASRIK